MKLRWLAVFLLLVGAFALGGCASSHYRPYTPYGPYGYGTYGPYGGYGAPGRIYGHSRWEQRRQMEELRRRQHIERSRPYNPRWNSHRDHDRHR